MGLTDGVKRNCCPVCGGKIIISDLHQYSINYTILKNGKMSKTRKKEDNGSMEAMIAGCIDCGESWNTDEFWIHDGYFFDCKDREEN